MPHRKISFLPKFCVFRHREVFGPWRSKVRLLLLRQAQDRNDGVPKSHQISNLFGFTLIELMIVISILGILYAVTFWAIEPDLIKKNARDGVRITDVGRLQGAIENYMADHGVPPDLNNSLRQSSVPASPSASPAAANGSGWIGQDLREYLESLPLDPLNTSPLVYRYKRVGINYELDAQMENNSLLSTGDGGNSSTRYEKGTDTTLIGD